MVLQQTYPVPEKISFAASTSKVLKLPTNGFITGIDIKVKLNVTTDATNGGTPKEDALSRIIKRLTIYSGEKFYFYARDGRQLKFRTIYDFKKVKEDALPTSAGVTQDVTALYKIRLGFEPTDPFDPSVAIPAELVEDLNVEVLFGSASDLGIGYTINSGEIAVTLYRLVLEEGETVDDLYPEGLVEPRFTAEDISIDQVVSDLGFQTNIPIGNIIRRVWFLQLDSSDNRSNSEISEVGVIDELKGFTPYRKDWDVLQAGDMLEYGLDTEYTGVAVLDGEEISGVPFGVDTSEEYKAGQLKLGLTTLRTGGTLKVIYEQLHA